MSFANGSASGSIDLGRIKTSQGVIYQMADKPMGQMYYEDVEALKGSGVSNADAVRQVADKYGKNQNAVRGGIHQYRSRHINGNGGSSSPSRGRRPSARTVDDYLANARQALQAARDLIDREVDDAKAALDAAQARYDEVQASVAERKADIEQKLKALA